MTSYGFKPQMMSLFAEETFYFYLTVQDGDKVYSLGIPENLNVEGFKATMDATLKRLKPGFLRTIGVWTPPSMGMNPMMAQFGGGRQSGKQFRLKGKGMPYMRGSGNGDLYVQVNTEVPVSLNKEQKELLEKFREIENEKSNPSIKKFFQKAKSFWKN